MCCVLGEGEGGEGRRKGARGVDLTVNPRIVNSNLSSRDIVEGMVSFNVCRLGFYPPPPHTYTSLRLCSTVPLQVLSGWVKSLEDHGYIIDFGVANKVGFLLKKNAKEFIRKCNRGRNLRCGQVVRCKVLSAVDARSIPVSVEPGVVGGALVGGDSLVQLHALQPGLLVNMAVKEVRQR